MRCLYEEMLKTKLKNYNRYLCTQCCLLTFFVFRLEVVRNASAHFAGGHQSALAVAVVLGVAPVRREVLLFRRPLLVQETLAVRFAEPVYRLVRTDVVHAHRYLRRLVEFAINLVTAGNIREIFRSVYHDLQRRCDNARVFVHSYILCAISCQWRRTPI